MEFVPIMKSMNKMLGIVVIVLLFSGCLEQGSESGVKLDEQNDQIEFVDPSEDNNESMWCWNNSAPKIEDVFFENDSSVAPVGFVFEINVSDEDVSNCSVLWDFDDGSVIESNFSVFHVFKSAGLYEVVVVVSDLCGQVDVQRIELVVEDPASDWEVVLSGAQQIALNKSMFESWVQSFGAKSWEDEGLVWTGIPLYLVVGAVDDVEQGPLYSFDEDLANRGYTVRLTAADGWVVELDSKEIALDDGYLLVDCLDGEPLPKFSPSGKPSWPLHLRGDKALCPSNIGNISMIELVGLTQDDDGGFSNWWDHLWSYVVPMWWQFFSDVFDVVFGG